MSFPDPHLMNHLLKINHLQKINLAVKLSSRDKNSQSLLARRSCSWWAKLLWVVVIIVLFGLEQSLKGCVGQLVLQINLWSFWGCFLDCQFHCSKSDFSLNCSHRHRLDVLFWCCAQVLLSKCHQHVSRANLDLSSFWQVTFYMLYMHASSRFWRLYHLWSFLWGQIHPDSYSLLLKQKVGDFSFQCR